MRQKSLLLLSALSLISLMSVPQARAQTMIQNKITIEMDNGKSSSTPMSIRAVDPQSGVLTTYVPIWYVMHTLEVAKSIQSTWDGHNWTLTLPSNLPLNLTPPLHLGSGPLHIYLNGTYVQDGLGIAHVDPASGKLTTYVPIWYVMQALKRANITSTWDGTNWGIHSWLSKWDALFQLIQMSQHSGGLSGISLWLQNNDLNPNPYDDVPSTVWSIIDEAIGYHVVEADSATRFGYNDPATLAWFDQIYWNWMFYSFNNLTPASHAPYEPGGNPQAWAKIIGLHNGLSQAPVLLSTDAIPLSANMNNLTGSRYQDTTGYHVKYMPIDEYTMFVNPDGTTNLPPNEQEAITKTYQEFNVISLDLVGSSYQFNVPTFPISSQWHVNVNGLRSDSQWSMDGGKTWTILGKYQSELTGNVFGNFVYDSSNATLGGSTHAPSQVLIKTTSNVTISFSESIDGKTYNLGQIKLLGQYNSLPGVERNKNPF